MIRRIWFSLLIGFSLWLCFVAFGFAQTKPLPVKPLQISTLSAEESKKVHDLFLKNMKSIQLEIAQAQLRTQSQKNKSLPANSVDSKPIRTTPVSTINPPPTRLATIPNTEWNQVKSDQQDILLRIQERRKAFQQQWDALQAKSVASNLASNNTKITSSPNQKIIQTPIVITAPKTDPSSMNPTLSTDVLTTVNAVVFTDDELNESETLIFESNDAFWQWYLRTH